MIRGLSRDDDLKSFCIIWQLSDMPMSVYISRMKRQRREAAAKKSWWAGKLFRLVNRWKKCLRKKVFTYKRRTSHLHSFIRVDGLSWLVSNQRLGKLVTAIPINNTFRLSSLLSWLLLLHHPVSSHSILAATKIKMDDIQMSTRVFAMETINNTEIERGWEKRPE